MSAFGPPPVPGVHFVPLRNLTGIGKRTSFRYQYFVQSGRCLRYKPAEVHLPVAATNNVAQKAVDVTCHTLAKITRYMPREVFISTARSYGVGLFTMAETLTVYPQNAKLADRPECYRRCDGACRITCNFDGRKWEVVPGITNSISLSNMETVLCMPTDIYRGRENIVTHEFSHLIHRYLDIRWRRKISAAYLNAKRRRMYRLDSYGMGTEFEYFAFASESFFHSVLRSDTATTGGINLCANKQVCRTELQARQFLQRYDPMIFEVLSYVYTNKQPRKLSGIVPCEN